MTKELPPVTDIDLYRGTTWPIDFIHTFDPADVDDAQIGFDIGSDNVIKITMDNQPGQWDIVADAGTVTILPVHTQDIDVDAAAYDIKLKLTDGTVEAVQRGLLKITDDVSGAFD